MKKTLAMVLSVALIAVMLITGTLAYLTDRDGEANVFTVGNVDIELNETFEQGATLTPGVKIEKKPTIENTGKNDAWVWATVAVPAALDSDDASKNVLHFNYYKDHVNSTEWTWKNTEGAWNVAQKEIDGVDYNVYTVLYQTALKAGEETPAVIHTVYMDTNVDIAPNGDWYHVENGETVKLDWNSNTDGSPVVYVNAYAIQKEEFATVQDAYEAYNEQWGENGEAEAAVSTVANAEQLVEALENGESVVLTKNIKIDPAELSNAYGTTGINVTKGQTIDGSGYTIDIAGAGGTWDSGINTTGGTIKNLTVTGSFRGIFINHNSTHSEPVVLDNVTIDGTTYTVSCDQGKNQTLTATNSIFKGWTSYAATLGSAAFENCSFGEGNGYAFMRPYAPTTYVGCDFEAGYQIDPRAAVTFENCTIGGVALTADNLATLVTSNIANATVK